MVLETRRLVLRPWEEGDVRSEYFTRLTKGNRTKTAGLADSY